MENSYIKIISTLVSSDVKFIIAGGVAAVLHGVERVTMDIDISLEMSQTNIEKFIKCMNQLEMIPRAPVPASFLLSEENRKLIVEEKNALVFSFYNPKNPMMIVDVFLTDDLSYEKISKHIEYVTIQNIKVAIVTADKLIELKENIIPMRSKDISDIERLKELKK